MQTEQDPSELIPSLQLLLKETCAFRQQHPGKFCLLVCSVCTFFAMLGRYIPGVVISYALVLGIFLWPLLSSLDLEPILQKMDLGLGNFLHRIRENHASGRSQPQPQPQPQPPPTEAKGTESDLSSMVPQMDLSLCKELCVSDTEASDISWTEGAFTLSEGHTPFSAGHTPLSEGHTPVTDQSEELDREGLADHLPEFPSLDNGSLTNGSSDEDDLYLAAPHPSAPDPMSLASAVIQQRMESALGLSGSSLDLCAARPDDSDSDVEDFELLDQSELEQCETELGLVQQETQESTERSSRHTVHGFLSRLLRRQ